ncbi:outer membrane beta-barrel protein [Bacteroidota bacterium]
MRKIICILMVVFVAMNLQAQEEGDTTKVGVGKKNILTVVEDDQGTKVNVNEDFVVVDEMNDTIKIKLGNKAISITGDGKKTNVEIIEDEDFDKHGWKEKPARFKGHWAGFELGLNNMVDKDFQLAGTELEHNFMDLNTGKSWEFDINFMQFNLPFGKPVGLVTGMGLKWNNYWFDGGNNIMKHPVNTVIVPSFPPAGVTYDKSKLNTFYLTVPLIFEVHFGPDKNGFIGLGVIGDLKLGSNTKIKYNDGGSKEREKTKSDFNLSPLRYHLTARAGFSVIKVFANYSMVPLFTSNMGPELFPVTIGLTLISFR